VLLIKIGAENPIIGNTCTVGREIYQYGSQSTSVCRLAIAKPQPAYLFGPAPLP
jgi:hypothetical protein